MDPLFLRLSWKIPKISFVPLFIKLLLVLANAINLNTDRLTNQFLCIACMGYRQVAKAAATSYSH